MSAGPIRLTALLAAATLAGATAASAQIVRGQVVDSLAETPIAGAAVTLHDGAGAQLGETTSDPDGLFQIRVDRGGSFYLRVTAAGYPVSEFPEFLLAPEQVRGFMLLLGPDTEPPPPPPPAAASPPPEPAPEVAAFITRVCGEGVVDPGQPVLIGQVLDSEGEPVPEADVILLWSAVPENLETHVGYQPSSGAATAGSTGHYAVCGAPVATRVVVHAQWRGQYSEFVSFRFEDGGVYVNGEYRRLENPLFQYDLQVLPAPLRTAALQGTISDSTGSRIESARITIDGTSLEARTNLMGAFELANLPPGTLRYTVEQIGYRPYRGVVEVDPDETVQLPGPIQLSRAPVALDPLRVEAERPDRRRPLVEFERRRNSANGQFLTREEWEQQGTVDEPVDILRRLRGIRIRPGQSAAQPWIITSGRGARGLSSGMSGGDCFPIVFLDRIYLGTTQFVNLDRAAPVHNLEAVEYYNATAGLPAEFNRPGAVCGVIVLWTR